MSSTLTHASPARRRRVLSLGGFLAAALLLPSLSFAQISRQDAIDAVTNEVILSSPNVGTLVAYAPQNMLVTGDVVEPFDLTTEPFPGTSKNLSVDTWFIWIDDGPSNLFVHQTRYCYVDANNPNPTVANGGIVVEVQGWWPVINGLEFYELSFDRQNSVDMFFGSPPDGRVLPDSGASSSTSPLFPGRGAILVSGSAGAEFVGDLNDLTTALQNHGGVPAANIRRQDNATKAQLNALITAANADNFDKIFVHIGSHGGQNSIQFRDRVYSAQELANCLDDLTAGEICITLEACHCGSLIDEISRGLAGRTGVTISATDDCRPSYYWVNRAGTDGNSYFVEDFIRCWGDARADGPDAGTDVSQEEAYNWVTRNGSGTTRGQRPQKRSHGLPVMDFPILPVDYVSAAFFEDFETPAGSVPGYMGVNALSQDPGIEYIDAWCNIGQQAPCINPESGEFNLELGLDPNTGNIHKVKNGLVLGLDGSGLGTLKMQFSAYNGGGAADAVDGVWVSKDGSEWKQVYGPWESLPLTTWAAVTGVDLSNAGVDTDGQFMVMFAQQGEFPFNDLDGVGIDNIEIVGTGSGQPTLEVVNFVSGQVSTVVVTNAAPNGVVAVVYSLVGGGPTSVDTGACGILPIEVSNPFAVLAFIPTNASGSGDFIVPLPPGITGLPIWFHALDLNSCQLSNSLAETVG